MGRGGKRVGSGRKKKELKRINRSVTLEPEIWDKLDEKAKEKEIKTGNLLVAKIIEEYFKGWKNG